MNADVIKAVKLRPPKILTDTTTGKTKELSMLLSNVSFYSRSRGQFDRGWNNAKSELQQKCQKDFWGDAANGFSILHNYVTELFGAVSNRFMEEEDRIGKSNDFVDYNFGVFFSDDENYMLFNTNLYNNRFEEIYMHCSRNSNQNHQIWYFQDWVTTAELAEKTALYRLMPRPFVFFKEYHELYYIPSLVPKVKAEHILESDKDHNRVPDALASLGYVGLSKFELFEKLESAINRMLVRVKQNSRTVVPQYFMGNIQLLLPLSFGEDHKVQLVIPVSKQELPLRKGELRDPYNPSHWQYYGRTVLDMDMAYNNARLINRLESEWLHPTDVSDPARYTCAVCNPVIIARKAAASDSDNSESCLETESIHSVTSDNSLAKGSNNGDRRHNTTDSSSSGWPNRQQRPLNGRLAQPQQQQYVSGVTAKLTHPRPYPSKPCFHFSQTGSCKVGDSCRYFHDPEWASNQVVMKDCRAFHSTGKCPHGDNCYFRH